MNKRIVGFDLARAYAIFGMYIVNFNFCFGSFQDQTFLGRLLNVFTGNSTAIFIICAGLGVSLMTSRVAEYSTQEKNKFKSIILKRSWFLFGLGLVLFNWWPADILHFYAAYMHIAAFILFVPKRYYLLAAIAAIAVFHGLLFIVPVFTSWDMSILKYADFWSIKGFLRNTLYNGWNSVFPWFAYFALGMWLGRINWQEPKIKSKIFTFAFILFVLFEGLRKYSLNQQFDRKILDYINYDYFPAYLPFMVISASFALMVIIGCIWLGDTFHESLIVKYLSITGKMTLTNYVQHLTIGMVLLQMLTGVHYTGFLQTGNHISPLFVLIYSIIYFIISILFSTLWIKKFKLGPLEMLMRKISG
jgi:uncharacterized protein